MGTMTGFTRKHPRTLWTSLIVALFICVGCGSEGADTASPDATDGPGEASPTPADDGPDESSAFADGDTVRIIIPWDAGGGYDLTTRTVAQCFDRHLSEQAGADVEVSVENMTGATGMVGNLHVWNAEPDGTTLLMNAVDIMVPQQVLEDAEIDIREYEAVARFIKVPRVLIVRDDVIPPDGDFLDVLARSEEEPILMGGGALRNQIRLMQAILEDAGHEFHVDLVDFDGTAEAVASMLRGELELHLVSIDGGTDAAEANEEVRLLAELSELPVDPSQEIAAAAGDNVRGIFAPPGTPPDVVSALEEAFQAAAMDPECNSELVSIAGTEDIAGSAAELEDSVTLMVDLYEEYQEVLD